MNAAACPTCTGVIEIGVGKGGLVECPDCGALWVLVSTAPPKLVYALDSEEEDVFADEEWPRPAG